MLTRHQIRIKVMQCLYATLYSEKTESVSKSDSLLSESINDSIKQYYFILYIVSRVLKKFEEQYYIAQKRYLDTDNNIFKTDHLLRNPFFVLLTANKKVLLFSKKEKFHKIDNVEEIIGSILNSLKESELLEEYQYQEQHNFESSRNFILKFFVEYIAPNQLLYDFIEHYDINWIVDFPLVNSSIFKLLETFKEHTEELVVTDNFLRNLEDRAFAFQLYQKVLGEHKNIEHDFQHKTLNWEFNRISNMDLLLIKMILTEVLYFPQIPTKVSINEYLEIAKEYSGTKSHIFINGVTDNVIKEYHEKKIITDI